MAKTIFEEMGGTYTQVGDYFLPDLKLPEEETKPIGVWGQRHWRYIKQHKRLLYSNLLTSGKLNIYLADIDRQAAEMFSRLVKQMAEREGVTEKLKAENQMAWVGVMNNIRNRAMEIVNANIVYNDCSEKTIENRKIKYKNAIGRWGRLRLDYIKQYDIALYQDLLGSNQLQGYLESVDFIAQERYENVETEYQKFGSELSNIIAEEIVLQEIIYLE